MTELYKRFMAWLSAPEVFILAGFVGVVFFIVLIMKLFPSSKKPAPMSKKDLQFIWGLIIVSALVALYSMGSSVPEYRDLRRYEGAFHSCKTVRPRGRTSGIPYTEIRINIKRKLALFHGHQASTLCQDLTIPVGGQVILKVSEKGKVYELVYEDTFFVRYDEASRHVHMENNLWLTIAILLMFGGGVVLFTSKKARATFKKKSRATSKKRSGS